MLPSNVLVDPWLVSLLLLVAVSSAVSPLCVYILHSPRFEFAWPASGLYVLLAWQSTSVCMPTMQRYCRLWLIPATALALRFAASPTAAAYFAAPRPCFIALVPTPIYIMFL